jgi:hypothetical protein
MTYYIEEEGLWGQCGGLAAGDEEGREVRKGRVVMR